MTDSWRIADDPSDNLGIWDAPTGGTQRFAFDTAGGINALATGLILKSGGTQFLAGNSSNTFIYLPVGSYNNIVTAGLSFPTIYGTPDWRIGVAAADGAPLTIYTTTAAAQVYKLFGRVYATTLGGGGAVSYVLKWTEGAVTITKTLTVNAVDVDAELTIPIQPDNATNITAQITALSGAATAANVAGWVEEVK